MLPGSVELLKVLFPILREEDHPHAEHIDRVLSAFVTSMALVWLLL